MKRTPISNKKINDYWVSRTDDPDFVNLVGDSSYENILEGEGKVCYACGVESKLEHAHIVPHSLGGPPIEENNFLLCRKCHRENPDTTYPDMFFKYIKNRKHYIQQAIEDIGMKLEEYLKDATSEEVIKYQDNSAKGLEDLLPKLEAEYKENCIYNGQVGVSSATTSVAIWKALTK